MRYLKIIPVILLLCALFVCRAEYRAYINDDAVVVTEAECGFEPLTELVLGKGEVRFIELRGSDYVAFATSDAFVARTDRTGAVVAADRGSAKIKVYYTETDYVTIKCVVKKAPASVRFDAEEISLDVESSCRVSWALNEGAAGAVSLYSSDEAIAMVEADGTITAVGAGECVITASCYNGVEGTCRVTVKYPEPATIAGPEEVRGYEGETLMLECAPEGGYHETLSYESLDRSIAEAGADGSVHCLKAGTCVIRVSASGGAVKDITLRVGSGTTSIVPVNTDMILYTGGEAELLAQCTGGSGAYTVTSSDESVLEIRGNTARAVKDGTAEVTFTAPSGVSSGMSVRVLRFPMELSLSIPDNYLIVGETATALYTGGTGVYLCASYQSDAPEVCSVTSEGVITARGSGTALISVTSGGVTQSVTVTVTDPAEGIYFENESLNITAGDTKPLDVRYKNGGGRVTFTSSDESIARCENGSVTGISPGTASVTAQLVSGSQAVLTVNVLPEIETLRFGAETLELCEQDEYDLIADLQVSAELVCSSSNTRVASVSNGKVKAETPGEAVITARTLNGVSASVKVTVTPAHAQLEVNAERMPSHRLFTHYLQLGTGDTYQLAIMCCRTYEIRSDDTDIISVTQDGTVTALKAGTAKITVTAACGAEAIIFADIR